MSKAKPKLQCLCGKDHVNEKPLIITITTCPKKNHQPRIITSPSQQRKIPNDLKPGQLTVTSENPDPLGHILFCEDEGVTIPKKNAAQPLIDNSTHCDMEHELGKLGPDGIINLAAPDKKNKENYSRGSEKDNGTDTYELEQLLREDEEERYNKNRPADNTFFDPSNSSNVKPADSRKELKSNKKVATADPVKEKPSKGWGIVKHQDKKNGSSSTTMSKQAKPSGVSVKEEASNFPSDIDMKLPMLASRYHGPGCAMEVEVLEKHDVNCRYRKSKNPKRNPADDRSGSYEVIGRLKFKTCHPTPPLDNHSANSNLPGTKVATIYSLFNLPFKFPYNKRLEMNSRDSERELKKYLRRKKLLEDLVKSSKSFPNRTPNNCLEEGKENLKSSESKAVQYYQKENVASYEVEVLYFYKRKCDKSVQMQQTTSSLFRRRRWFYFMFPCVMVRRSHSTLLNEY
ncbi:hypothetical protein NQ315_006990 [Exocentrus adspersus]|uniref:Uncharacterized protein n=1 Tax=Exocentrus adspersus TaxID=1586481 RepID=A0AAV8WCE0_9CUCU|nr:hypothetical protein NQ315_006990 [Exocentrus adspersus]